MKEEKNMGNLYIGIIIILILIICGGAYYILSENNDSTDLTSTTETVNTQNTPPAMDQRAQAPVISTEEQEAMDAGDYEAWLSAITEDNPFIQYIENEADFLKYVEMEEAKKNGDEETAESLRIELGLPEVQQHQPPTGLGM